MDKTVKSRIKNIIIMTASLIAAGLMLCSCYVSDSSAGQENKPGGTIPGNTLSGNPVGNNKAGDALHNEDDESLKADKEIEADLEPEESTET